MRKILLISCNYIDSVGLLLPLLSFWIFRKRNYFPGKIFLIAYFLIFFLLTFYATVIADLGYFNNPIYDVIPLILSIIVYFFFQKQQQSPYASLLSSAMLLLIFVLYVVTFKSVIDIDLNTEYYLFFSIFVLMNATLYLLNEINRLHDLNIHNTPQFWFIVCLTFYALASALVWGSFEYVKSRPSILGDLNIKYFWVVTHNPILFISCLVFSISLARKGKKLEM